jgi:hypothetical protein
MGDLAHTSWSSSGLLLAGAGVFAIGFLVFCCIDHCWLRRDLRRKPAPHWSSTDISQSSL